MALLPSENENFKLNGYNLVANYCRTSNRGGGVALFVSKGLSQSISVKELTVAHHCKEKVFEAAAIKIKSKGKECTVIATYRTPNDCSASIDEFLDRLDLVHKETKSSYTVIMGDLNICLNTDSTKRNKLLDFMNSVDLISLLPQGAITRAGETRDSCLDLILSDFKKYKTIIHKNAISDHYGVATILEDFWTKPVDTSCRRDFSDENHSTFDYLLNNHDWSDVFSKNDPNEAFDRFHSVVTSCYDLVFMKREKKINNKCKWPAFSDKARELKAKLTRCAEGYHASRTDEDRIILNNAKEEYTSELRQCRSEHNLKLIQESDNKSKSVWAVVNSFRKDKGGNRGNIVLELNGKQISEPMEVAQTLNDFYTISIEKITSDNEAAITNNKIDVDIFNPHIDCLPDNFSPGDTSETEVTKVIRGLKNSNAGGPDEISSAFLKKHLMSLVKPLVHLVNLSLREGVFPEKLKVSKVIALFKGGNENDPARYRPLALNSVFSKVYEKIFMTRLVEHVMVNNIISERQYGYQKGKGTVDAIVDTLLNILENIDNKTPLACLLLDLCRAFECVKHEFLLKKLEEYGIKGKALAWVQSFLSGRTQYVQVQSQKEVQTQGKSPHCFHFVVNSKENAVNCGVPTGSVAGAFLYTLYVNMILYLFKSARKYCDDTTVLIGAKNSDDLAELINNNLKDMYEVFLAHNLLVNGSKTNLMVFNCNQGLANIVFNGEPIAISNQVKFLGVIVDSNMKWKGEIESLSRKLHSAIYVIWSLTRTCNKEVAILAYHSIFLSRISYSILFWGNSSIENMEIIFKIQKRAIRTINKMSRRESCRGTFRQMNLLTIPSLYCFLAAKWTREKSNLVLRSDVHSHQTRGRNLIQTEHHRTRTFEQSVVHMGSKILNALPREIINEESNSKFVSGMKKYFIAKELYSISEMF